MIFSISNAMPTPEEQKGLELREKKEKDAAIAVDTARHALSEAQSVYSRARRDYKKAVDELAMYRERISPARRS